ncbi:hypothetical protein FJT64_001201 [Amphibalanus amphitrite]|uniref:Uncharacterized protein n=1 Tax=Amphibalanus amphitrite TaxID=1232801 RepID=A0A6A4V2X9_AMPAM|nr:hypothetical protein FJT64_001201 [Amphibalanus amphitrite]
MSMGVHADWRPAAGAGQSAGALPRGARRLAAEGIEQVFLVQVTVLPELWRPQSRRCHRPTSASRRRPAAPDWRRSLVLVNWNEAAHQLELPLSVLGAREAEFPGAVRRASGGGGARQLRCWCARGYGARY